MSATDDCQTNLSFRPDGMNGVINKLGRLSLWSTRVRTPIPRQYMEYYILLLLLFMLRRTVYRFFVLSTYWKQSISKEILAITDLNVYSPILSKVVTVTVRKYECFIKKIWIAPMRLT